MRRTPSRLFASVLIVTFGAAAVATTAEAGKPCNPRRKACPDNVPPTVSIAAPTAGSIVSGVTSVTGVAADNVAVTSVEVQVDDGAFQLATGTTSWSFAIDTTAYSKGSHVVSARASDAKGNRSGIASVTVDFANATGADPNVLSLLGVRVDRPTLHAIGVQVLIEGDRNRNGRIDIRFREFGAVEWQRGLPLLRVFPETITVPVPEQFAGSVFDLRPATSYEIELHALDSDGDVNETRLVTAATRPVPPSLPTSPRSVSVTDTATLKAALGAAQAGDVITLAAGRYVGPFAIAASGTAARPIVLRGSSAGVVVLDGNNCGNCNVLEVSGSFIHIERLTIANAFRGLRFTGANTAGNVARRLIIDNVVHGTGSNAGQRDFYICDNVIDGRLHWPWVFETNATSHWDDRGVDVTGDGHVVCHNTIRGFGDPVVNKKRQARSWDVYGNDIADAFDGVELDEGEGNVRMFHNRFTNVMAPISIQPVFGGPAYALRNVMFNVADEQVKLKSLGGVEEPSGALVYHNTFVSPFRALTLLSTITQHNFVLGNNLFVGPSSLSDARTVDWRAGIDRGAFDYNGYFPDGQFLFGTVGGVDRLYSSFAAVKATGAVEPHGVLLTGRIFEGDFLGPADPRIRHSAPDFALAGTSNAIDKGQPLDGINDGFKGSAPDLGALEADCPLPTYGPRPEGTESLTSLINCR